MSERWEQAGPGEEQDVVQRYLDDEAADSGPGSTATPGEETASGESSDPTDQIAERVLAQLESKLDAMRQDLQSYAERTAQSFSDKTASRLTRQQKERMDMIDRILEPLKDDLGPEYEDARRRAKLSALLEGGAETEEREEPGQPAPAPQPSMAGQSDFASAYMSLKLGDPSLWSAEDQTAIQRDLAQARDLAQWIAVVDRYAERRPSQSVGGQGSQGERGRIARAQPVGTQSAGRAQPTLEALSRAYNKAAAEGDLDAVNKLGGEIDKVLARERR